MSQENVQLIQAAIDAVNTEDVEGMQAIAAPDFEYDGLRLVGPFRGVYSRAEVPRAWQEFTETWESVRHEADEFIEATEHVVTPMTAYLRGRDGIEVQARGAYVWTIRDGTLARLCYYQSRAEALEAVGLSEQDAHADS
jgi:ketosteroid isomerase-like protein